MPNVQVKVVEDTEQRLNTPTLVVSEQTGLHPERTVAVQVVAELEVQLPAAVVSLIVKPPVPPKVIVVEPVVVRPVKVCNAVKV